MLASKIFFLCVFLIYVGIVAAHNSAKGRADDGGITDECLDELGFWPLPSSCSVDTSSMPMFLSPSFTIGLSASSQGKLSPSENEMLQKLVERYNKVLKPLMASKNSVPQEGLQLDHLEISVASSIGIRVLFGRRLKTMNPTNYFYRAVKMLAYRLVRYGVHFEG